MLHTGGAGKVVLDRALGSQDKWAEPGRRMGRHRASPGKAHGQRQGGWSRGAGGQEISEATPARSEGEADCPGRQLQGERQVPGPPGQPGDGPSGLVSSLPATGSPSRAPGSASSWSPPGWRRRSA